MDHFLDLLISFWKHGSAYGRYNAELLGDICTLPAHVWPVASVVLAHHGWDWAPIATTLWPKGKERANHLASHHEHGLLAQCFDIRSHSKGSEDGAIVHIRLMNPLPYASFCCRISCQNLKVTTRIHKKNYLLYIYYVLFSRTTDTQWRHKTKISEKLGWCGRQNMLWPYLEIWEWELIFGRAVKVIFSPGIHSPFFFSKSSTLNN